MMKSSLPTPDPAGSDFECGRLGLDVGLGLLVATAAVVSALFFPHSAARCGQELRNGTLAPMLLCGVCAGALGRRGFQLPIGSFALTAVMSLLPLWWLWYSGTSETMLVGGLLPFSDAANYLIDARNLADGGCTQSIGIQHPLATAMWGSLWKLTNADCRLMLAVIALVGAAASWVAMAEVTLLLGIAAGAAWLVVDFLFLRRFIGTTLSEPLGIVFGNIGIALGCRAARANNESNYVLAFFSLTLALCARAGAMLTLPALVVGAFLARPNRERRRWILPAAMAAAASSAFLLNSFTKEVIGDQRANAVSNVVQHLHSLVNGGTWEDAMNRYGNNNLAVWHAVKEQLRLHPYSLLRGAARSIMAFVQQFYLFSFVARRWLNAALHLAFSTGAIAAIIAVGKDRRAWWIAAFLVGLLASIPVLPPWDTDVMRAYAATIPLIALTVAFGTHIAFSRLFAPAGAERLYGADSKMHPIQSSIAGNRVGLWSIAIGLLALSTGLCVLLPSMLGFGGLPNRLPFVRSYALGRSEAIVDYLPRAAVRIVGNELPASMSGLRLEDFVAGMGALRTLYPAEAALLASFPSGCALIPGSYEITYVAIDAGHIPQDGSGKSVNLRMRYLAAGWLLIAADETLVARSGRLAAYCSRPVGQFSFGINRYPVIRAGDTVTCSKPVYSVRRWALYPERTGVNPGDPIILGTRRLRFPLPGEYYLEINGLYPLKVLVLPRDATKVSANQRIDEFVAATCVVASDEGSERGLTSGASALERWSESSRPTRMSGETMLGIVTLLERNQVDVSAP